MKLVRIGGLMSLMFVLAACTAPETKYSWGGYEGTLYSYYKHPEEVKEAAAALSESITTAESKGEKVPPGIYAEYGYMELVLGESDQAIANFEKEKSVWPESAILMNNMIGAARIPPTADVEKANAKQANSEQSNVGQPASD